MELKTSKARAIQSIYDRIPEPGTAEVGVAVARLGVGRARDAVERGISAALRAQADATKTDAGRAVAAYKAAKAATADALGQMNKTRQSIADEMQRTDTRLASLLRPTEADQAFIPMVVDHFRNLKTGDALKLLGEAQEAGDLMTQRALLSVPGYMTRLPPAILDNARNALQEKLDPEAAAYRQRLTDAFDAVNSADSVLASVVRDFDTPQVRQLIEAATEAEAA